MMAIAVSIEWFGHAEFARDVSFVAAFTMNNCLAPVSGAVDVIMAIAQLFAVYVVVVTWYPVAADNCRGSRDSVLAGVLSQYSVTTLSITNTLLLFVTILVK